MDGIFPDGFELGQRGKGYGETHLSKERASTCISLVAG